MTAGADATGSTGGASPAGGATPTGGAAAPDDAPALAALRSGDPDAVARLVTDWTPAMLRLARAHVGTQAAAEDVVQDAWLTALTGVHRFEGRSALRTWVLGIVVRTARRAGERERRLVPLSPSWWSERAEQRAPAVEPSRFAAADGHWVCAPLRWDTPEHHLAAAELRAVLDTAIGALPVRQRAVVVARDLIGMAAGDVEGLYGLTDGAQRVLLHRGRARLRAAVETYVAAADSVSLTGATVRPVPAGGVADPGSGRPALPGPGQEVVCRQLVELVDDYLDAMLDPDLRRRVEEHLADCDSCDGYVAQVRRLLDVTSQLVPAAPAELVDRLVALVRRPRPG